MARLFNYSGYFICQSMENELNNFLERETGMWDFVYIKRAKLDEIKDQTRAKPLIRQFKLTALGLNEPLHSLACLVRRTAQQAH